MLRGVLVVVAWGLFAPLGAAAGPGLDEILAQVRRAEAEREAAVRETAYTAEARVLEWEDPSRSSVERETVSLRRVYTRKPDLVRNEYLSMRIDGRLLSEEEMERELAKQRRGGGGGQGGGERGGGQFQSPFSPEAAEQYEFRLIGEVEFEGQPAWEIGFAPRAPDPRRMEGRALFSRDGYQPLYVEMVPSKLPGVLEELSMSMRFAPVQGYWLPERFLMNMRLRVSVIVTLADRILTIEDRYSGYSLNPGLPDSLFAPSRSETEAPGPRSRP
ncbi:MAG: hypothetical protein JW820_15610 [Spirochaetales bacterium]|nr:hypothetical protein [Spirochaetales bacterium]